jgi:hypothetical protein
MSESTGATAVGFGRRKKDKSLRDEWCLTFVVPRKAKSPRFEAIPRLMPMRVQIRGAAYAVEIPTDVVEIRRHLERVRPAAGDSAAAGFIFNQLTPTEVGSAGAFVGVGSKRYVLTAAHVAARTRTATDAKPGEPICDVDGNVFGKLARIGKLARGHDTALIEPTIANVGHLFVRQGDDPVTIVCPEAEVGLVHPDQHRLFAWRGEQVSCFHCWLDSMTVPSAYAAGSVTFKRLIQFDCSATGGDSGALVVDDQYRGVGLHIMGIEGADTAYSLCLDRLLPKLLPGKSLKLLG